MYPYEYMDDFKHFHETSLPAKEAFYSTLSEQDIGDGDYHHAQEVWNTFHCNDLGEYHDLYLDGDVYLLADVFENFRSMALVTYNLDPAGYFTLPGFAWDALLKYTGVSLTLLSDVDMHLFIERGLLGGISMASERHARANNKHMSSYDPSQASSYFQYLDPNNLYGWAMCQYLPTSNFEWCPPSAQLLDVVLSQPDDASTGYIMECDLSVPPESPRSSQ